MDKFIGQNKRFIEYVKMFSVLLFGKCVQISFANALATKCVGPTLLVLTVSDNRILKQCSLRLVRKRAICYQSEVSQTRRAANSTQNTHNYWATAKINVLDTDAQHIRPKANFG